MQKTLIVAILFCFALGGCRLGKPSEEETKKIAELTSEIVLLEGKVSEGEQELEKYESGLVPTLIKARIETDKLTISIIRQHIASLESGGKITIETKAIPQDTEMLASLEKEYDSAKQESMKAKAESSLYSGGLVKSLADSRAATYEQTMAMIYQRMLASKYGLWVPQQESPQNATTSTSAASPINNKKESGEYEISDPLVDDPGPFNFRKTRWGMSQKEVEEREGKPEESDGTNFYYNDKLLNEKVAVIFTFRNNKLWNASYILAEKYVNKNNYVDAYNKIATSLKEKYGPPNDDKTIWSNNLFKGNYAERGTAYASGHVYSYTEWETDDSTIKIVIRGEGYKITVGVLYESKLLAQDAKNEENEKEKSKL